jgi:hypothetical protein
VRNAANVAPPRRRCQRSVGCRSNAVIHPGRRDVDGYRARAVGHHSTRPVTRHRKASAKSPAIPGCPRGFLGRKLIPHGPNCAALDAWAELRRPRLELEDLLRSLLEHARALARAERTSCPRRSHDHRARPCGRHDAVDGCAAANIHHALSVCTRWSCPLELVFALRAAGGRVRR